LTTERRIVPRSWHGPARCSAPTLCTASPISRLVGESRNGSTATSEKRFLTEAEAAGIKSFEQLNDDFSAWAEQVANTRIHAETKEAPIARFLKDGPPALPEAALVRGGLPLVSHPPGDQDRHGVALRQSLRGRPGSLGRVVELRFDPEDLGVIDVVLNGEAIGRAVPSGSGATSILGPTGRASRARRTRPRDQLPRARPTGRGRGPKAGLASTTGRSAFLASTTRTPARRRDERDESVVGALRLHRDAVLQVGAADKLFGRTAHDEAVARIQYCIAESSLGVVTGEVGAGKSVAVRAAVAGLDRTRYTVVYIANPSGGCRGLYVAITTALGATPRFHKAEAIQQVADLLAAEQAERHRKVVFLIDEAHLLTPEQLEELRLLSNADMDSSSPFAGLLVGQPTLATRLRQGVFAALDQRISVRYAIAAWTSPSRSATSGTTWSSPAGATSSSRTTPPRGCTATPMGSRGRSTTPPGRRSWRQPPTGRGSSTTSARRRRWPSSPAPDTDRNSPASTRWPSGSRSAPVRVLTQSCRSVLAESCQNVVIQCCRQHRSRSRRQEQTRPEPRRET